MHQVLEHTRRGLLEFGRHLFVGLRIAMEQERARVSELTQFHSKPAYIVEVSIYGEGCRALRANF
ncbi:hypothetical protein KSP39_PZI001908 [Platanthera zijinensis]|uniref:Uncharacterized protein n=1 Tax=Platanthera zijinensis TaxID=2320716 RepID=A0AAP0C0K0_9ASPA